MSMLSRLEFSPRGQQREQKKNTSEKTNKKKSRWSDMEQRSMSVNYKFFSFCSEHRACEAIKSLTNILTSAVWWSLQLTQHVLRDNETAQWSSFTCLTRSLAKAKHRLQKRKSFNAVGWKAQKPKIHHVINFSSFAGGLRIDGKIRFSKTDFFFVVSNRGEHNGSRLVSGVRSGMDVRAMPLHTSKSNI